MMIEATFIFNKRGITLLVFLNPVADVLPQFEVVGRTAVKLVGEGAEQAVAVADSVCCIQSKLAQLRIEHLTVLFRVGHKRLIQSSG